MKNSLLLRLTAILTIEFTFLQSSSQIQVFAQTPQTPQAAQTSPASQTEQTASAPTAPSTDTPTSTRQLQTGVTKVELSLEKLRDVGLDLKHLIKDAGSLYDEVAIQPVALMTEPEVIGTTVINVPIGVQPTGPFQQPRKERLELTMNTIKPVVGLLKTNVDEFMSGAKQLDLSSDVLSELQPKLTEWVDLVNKLSAQEGQLESLTVGPTFNNAAIASSAVDMQKTAKKLDETRRAIYKVIRKRAKG
ncbi:MAG TPA: hypothetical protein V6C97_28790 [Oculatellaceae cyanobacterium]